MFSPALPGVALLALLNNLVEIRSDAHKLLRLSRRCHALPISPFVGIGAWRRIITLLTCAGIVTNVLLIVYTTDLFDRLEARGWPQLAIAFIAEHILLALKLLTDWVVPDVPSKVWEEEARWQWMEDLRKRRLEEKAQAENKRNLAALHAEGGGEGRSMIDSIFEDDHEAEGWQGPPPV